MESKTTAIKKRGIYILPNLFTISALFAGFYAVIAGMRGVYDNAAIAIFIAMIMDSLDGRIARLTHTQTEFGAQLDSLSDMVSFGIAPAFVAYSWSLSNLGKFGWLAAFVYAVAGVNATVSITGIELFSSNHRISDSSDAPSISVAFPFQ